MIRMGNNVNRQFLISIYYAHIHIHLSYMSPVWGHSDTENLISTLQIAQNNAIRSIFRERYFAFGLSTEQIRNDYGIFSVRQLIKFNSATLAFKIERSMIKTDIVINHLGDRHNYRTRNAGSIYQSFFRSNAGKYRQVE